MKCRKYEHQKEFFKMKLTVGKILNLDSEGFGSMYKCFGSAPLQEVPALVETLFIFKTTTWGLTGGMTTESGLKFSSTWNICGRQSVKKNNTCYSSGR